MAFTSQKPAALDKVAKEQTTYGAGAILRLNGRTLAIYKKAVPEKEYHLVLMLSPGGSVKAQGVALEGYEVEELGCIAPKWFEKMQTEMHWDRDLIVFHCYSFEDVVRIPRAEGGEETLESVRPAPAAPPPPRAEAEQVAVTPTASPVMPPPVTAPPKPEANGSMRRGQRLQIKFGNNTWDAVYWGKDDQGQVIAHKTYEQWALMHLDLKRFTNSMLIDPEADLTLVQEIEQSLLKA